MQGLLYLFTGGLFGIGFLLDLCLIPGLVDEYYANNKQGAFGFFPRAAVRVGSPPTSYANNMPPTQGYYGQGAGGYPPQQGGYPSQQGGYPPQQGGMMYSGQPVSYPMNVVQGYAVQAPIPNAVPFQPQAVGATFQPPVQPGMIC